jgi:hypothetical protein
MSPPDSFVITLLKDLPLADDGRGLRRWRVAWALDIGASALGGVDDVDFTMGGARIASWPSSLVAQVKDGDGSWSSCVKKVSLPVMRVHPLWFNPFAEAARGKTERGTRKERCMHLLCLHI